LAIRDESCCTAQRQNNNPTLFSDDERLLLSTIPYPLIPKNLLANNNNNDNNMNDDDKHPKQLHQQWCGLLGIILAYVYDHLTTMGDATVESAWTISVLSPGLSWLDSSPSRSVRLTLEAFLRRLMVYPCWRNAEGLGRRVLVETLELLQSQGIHGITRALLQVRTSLDKSEVYYLGNKLFVDPYLYWIQNQPNQDKTETNSGTAGLERILSEMAGLVHDDDSFGKLVARVETSLGIDAMMEEYFGSSDGENDDENVKYYDDASISSSSSSKSDSSSSSYDDDNDDAENDGKEGDETEGARVSLLDDEIGTASGVGSREEPSRSSMLYCVGDESRSTTATPLRPLVTEVLSATNAKKPLIQEL
jgi:hypothetical protein